MKTLQIQYLKAPNRVCLQQLSPSGQTPVRMSVWLIHKYFHNDVKHIHINFVNFGQIYWAAALKSPPRTQLRTTLIGGDGRDA